MGLRPARCYRELERPYTRYAPRVQDKNYVGGVPGRKMRAFTVGDQTKNYDWVLDVKVQESAQIRDEAFEALRKKMVKELTAKVGKDNYLIKFRLVPHHILRENKTATGAGADRVSKGMKHAFGKNIGWAAQVRKNQILLSLLVNTEHLDAAKEILKKVKYKMHIKYKILVSKHENMRLSGRKKWTREMKKAAAEAQQSAKSEEKK